ncbi:YhbY family RNA-binding protein [Methanovulcanius yangii]|uniref:YhbY family RNA-binding protein n=1 Tax=Methanovulcanius yangii TaxID=1789227 RepID=UPI0029CAA042|nr:YhbY family RNA-binding protein [Methanovulcanius yangii]
MGNNRAEQKEASRLKASVWIGKNGVSEHTIDEICRQIRDNRIVKIKWLRSTEVEPEEIAHLCAARLIQVRGRTMVLGRR